MKQTIVVPAAILIALSFAIDANAEDRGERRSPPSFAEIDSNADQLLSREEMEAMKANMGRKGGHKHKEGKDPEGRFDKADSDGDGYLSEAEFDVVREKKREHRDHRRHGEASDDESQDDSEE